MQTIKEDLNRSSTNIKDPDINPKKSNKKKWPNISMDRRFEHTLHQRYVVVKVYMKIHSASLIILGMQTKNAIGSYVPTRMSKI